MNLNPALRPTLTKTQKLQVLAKVRELSNYGKHLQASKLYNSVFPA